MTKTKSLELNYILRGKRYCDECSVAVLGGIQPAPAGPQGGLISAAAGCGHCFNDPFVSGHAHHNYCCGCNERKSSVATLGALPPPAAARAAEPCICFGPRSRSCHARHPGDE